MPVYDHTLFSPPAPMARVTLRDPETGSVLPDVLMLIQALMPRWFRNHPLICWACRSARTRATS
jgi:hypothetical protein